MQEMKNWEMCLGCWCTNNSEWDEYCSECWFEIWEDSEIYERLDNFLNK